MIGDRKTENILTNIKDSSITLENGKSTQFIGGKSFVTYITNSNAQYDYSLSTVASYKAARIIFTFDENASDKFHIVQPTIYYRMDNPDVMGDPVILSNGSSYIMRYFQDGISHGSNSYIIQLSHGESGTHTFYFKYYFYGTVKGTFSTTTL